MEHDLTTFILDWFIEDEEEEGDFHSIFGQEEVCICHLTFAQRK